jgi:tetratricopeptide (TPR) repeat protein
MMKAALRNKPFLTYEADIFYHLGLAYCRLEKFEKSIFPYTRCIEKIPSDLRYIHERAKAYQMIDSHELAVADFDYVIKKNPKNANAYFRRAFSLKSLKVSLPSSLSTSVQCILSLHAEIPRSSG